MQSKYMMSERNYARSGIKCRKKNLSNHHLMLTQFMKFLSHPYTHVWVGFLLCDFSVRKEEEKKASKRADKQTHNYILNSKRNQAALTTLVVGMKTYREEMKDQKWPPRSALRSTLFHHSQVVFRILDEKLSPPSSSIWEAQCIFQWRTTVTSTIVDFALARHPRKFKVDWKLCNFFTIIRFHVESTTSCHPTA